MSDETQNPNPQPTAPQASQPSAPANADIQAMLGLLSEMKAEIDSMKAGRQEPKPEPKPELPAGTPEWAGHLLNEITALKQERANEQVAAKRSALQNQLLAGVPQQHRAMGEMIVKGLLVDQRIDASTDVTRLAEQLAPSLKSQYPTLYVVPGSSRPATPLMANGQIDWSQVRTWEDIPLGRGKDVPMDVIARLKNGQGTDVAELAIPQPLFQKVGN